MQLGDFYGQTGAVVSSITGSTNSQVLLYENKGGRKVLFYNHSSAAMFLKFGPGASLTDFSVKLSSGSYYETPMPVHSGAFTCVWDAAAGSVKITVL